MADTDSYPVRPEPVEGERRAERRSWFDKRVLSNVEGLTTNGNVDVNCFNELQ